MGSRRPSSKPPYQLRVSAKRRLMEQPNRPPWVLWRERHSEPPKSSEALRQWRLAGRFLAQLKGSPWSCDLCKRPIGLARKVGSKGNSGRPAHVTIMPAQAWASSATTRYLCRMCWLKLDLWIRQREQECAGWELAPEPLPSELQTHDPSATTWTAVGRLPRPTTRPWRTHEED